MLSRRVRTPWFCCSFVATAAVALSGSTAAAQGSIRGTVTRADTHSPISGATVSVANPQRIATTDQKGAYVLRNLPAGTYVVTTTAIGRAPDSGSVAVPATGTVSHEVSLKEGSLLLSSVIVSATRTAVEASKVTATVNVLTSEQVRQTPAREAQDMLREIPAVELPRTSSLVGGTAQIVSIRGVDEGRTAVLFDGIPVNDAWGEWIDWGRVPKAMIDHVEVLEGGTSNLYGNGAMGGVISFFGRPMSPGSMDLQADGGSRSARHAYLGAGVPLGSGFSVDVNGDYQEGGGYKLIGLNGAVGPIDVASTSITRNGYARLNYAPSSQWSAFATGHFFGDSRGLGTPLSAGNRDQRDADFGVNGQGFGGGTLAIRGWDGRQIENQRATTIRSATLRNAEDSSADAQIPSHDWGASALWTRTGLIGLESFSAGADYRHYQGDYNETDYNTTGCPTAATCGSIARQISSGGNQSLSGAFLQAIAAPISPLRIELSGRVDQWNNDDGRSFLTGGTQTTYQDRSKTAFSPRLGARYQVVSSFSLHAAVYKAFRAPNLAELYRKQVSPTSITVPNPDLGAETALGREVGFDWQPVDWIQAKGTYYVAEYNDFNVPVTLTANKPAECGAIATCRVRQNVNAERSQGGEAYIAVRPVHELFISAGVNYDDDRQQSGLPATATDATKPHINRVPSPRQTIRATYSSNQLGDWTLMWRHEGRTTTLGGIGLAPFTVVDANIQRELVPGLRGFVSVENIGDAKYQVNIAGSGTAASPFVYSIGLPRTVRAGIEAFRW
ncbi:MAG TPA: TonB-dependent receptor [Gemmatimonadaceae bacterium]|nr:TonB-dependent receptor [Gemmatimonadaceae bacterium]